VKRNLDKSDSGAVILSEAKDLKLPRLVMSEELEVRSEKLSNLNQKSEIKNQKSKINQRRLLETIQPRTQNAINATNAMNASAASKNPEPGTRNLERNERDKREEREQCDLRRLRFPSLRSGNDMGGGEAMCDV
jgi:hypothetical protein